MSFEMDMIDALDREDDGGPLVVQNMPFLSASAQLQQNAMMVSTTDSEFSVKSVSTVSGADVPVAANGRITQSLTYGDGAPMAVSLMDGLENLKCDTESRFRRRTNIQGCVYVVSVFGNTGEGKSHLLNHTFFGGKEVFPVFSDGRTTEGVYVAFRPEKSLVIVDTEGLLNPSCPRPQQQTRLLFKVLAVSDVVIFHSRAERLPSNLFTFLGGASKAYRIFRKERVIPRDKGPLVVINHRPSHARPLHQTCGPQGPEADLRKTFQAFNYDLNSFSGLKYIGTSRENEASTELLSYILRKLEEPPTRERRSPDVVFRELYQLNERFKGKIDPHTRSFPEECLVCDARCECCDVRCSRVVDHDREHDSSQPCEYKARFENRVYRCRKCDANRLKVEVVPKACSGSDSTLIGLTRYLWSGYVLECRNCGVIYHSREHWYGNPEPNDTVITEIRHVWPGPSTVLQGTHNAGRKVVDGVTYLSETISHVSSGATSVLAQWATDIIKPSYWVPNSEIRYCTQCKKTFEGSGPNVAKGGKHHCRGCGKGFCADCSRWKRTVEERGWGKQEVRVCQACYVSRGPIQRTPETEVNLRKKIETVTSTVGTLTSVVLDLPMEYLKDSTRPAYWVPDAEITKCFCCGEKFDELRTLHHCRSCGQGVCEDCSQARRPVPNRGWDHPVRVCDKCPSN